MKRLTYRNVVLLALFLPVIRVTAAEPVRLGNQRQLFLDDRIIASMQRLQRTWHSAEKYSGNPVLKREQPWEGRGPYAYGTAFFDPKASLFKLWYNCYVGGRPDYWACHAISKDGIHWERPKLNAVADPRLPSAHNVVMLGSGLPSYRQCLSPSVLYRPEEPDPQRRYVMLYWDMNAGRDIKFLGVCLAFSADGIHWTNVKNNPVFEAASDVTDACYDPVHNRFLLHCKMWRVDGEGVSSSPGVNLGDVSYWTAWDTSCLPSGRIRFKGGLVDYAAANPRSVKATMDFEREPPARRVVARAESKDLIHWTNSRLVFELPQQGDAPGTSTYGMSVFPYEGMYIGLLRIFHNEREIDLHLAYSRDDLDWKRAPVRTPFISRGPAGSHDAGMVFLTNAPVLVGDELWFYYGAFTGHHAVADDKQSASICLAKLRRDGFVSLDAGAEQGELVTVPFLLQGEGLTINATAKHGALIMEIRDEHGQPQPGFRFADCDVFRRDAVTHRITWRSGASLQTLKGKHVQLAFHLRQARLYAFQVGDDPAGR